MSATRQLPASDPVGPGPRRDGGRARTPRYAHAGWQAWGTYVFLGVADATLLDPARALTERLMGELDRAISRFRADSDLARVNAGAGDWVAASPWLVEAVEVALAAARQTDGLVDPTLGLVIAHLGYDADLDEVRARPDSQSDVGIVSGGPPATGPARRPTDLPQAGRLTGAWRWVGTLPGRVAVPAGSALDLGATGKAFAADRISAAIAEQVGTDCILSIGGDVAVGSTAAAPGRPDVNCEPASDPRPPVEHSWQVTVSELPGEPSQEIITLPSGGVATSTTLHRTWRHRGRPMHHLLDPATGRPVCRLWRTATVRAHDCVSANVASTAALVMGGRAAAWLQQRGLSARLVSRDGAVVTVGGWPGAHPTGGPRR